MGAVLDAVLVAGDQAAADPAVVEVLPRVVEQVGAAAAAIELTDEPCMVAGAQGFGLIDHAGYARTMEHATWTILDFRICDDVRVRRLGDDTAVIAYTVHEQLEIDGDPVAFDAADTSTWVRRAGRWLCAAHTESIAGDPFGRDRRAA